ncbi:hypothetical protein LZ30DRAFT_145135 [Colletotrichum cereale]|nr:hypothetical protein LZ30DRAFT_145135 [Colletotrichum cereale]
MSSSPPGSLLARSTPVVDFTAKLPAELSGAIFSHLSNSSIKKLRWFPNELVMSPAPISGWHALSSQPTPAVFKHSGRFLNMRSSVRMCARSSRVMLVTQNCWGQRQVISAATCRNCATGCRAAASRPYLRLLPQGSLSKEQTFTLGHRMPRQSFYIYVPKALACSQREN